jgi:retinol dehydrogenase 12
LDNLDYHIPKPTLNLYGNSKAGNYLHATEFARRYKTDGIVSVALHPGNLESDLYRDQGSIFNFFLRHTILYPPVFGAYTELFAGLSPQVSMEKTGSWGGFSF